MSQQYRHAVSALVVRPVELCSPDGCLTRYELLVVHKPRINDAWQLPQGGMEEGESLEQAALRELEEETGLKNLTVTRVSEQNYRYDFPPEFLERFQPMNRGQTLSFVLVLVPRETEIAVDRNEIDSAAWILPEQLPLYLKREEYREIVEKVIRECLVHIEKRG